MNKQTLSEFLRALHLSKRIVSMMPKLPEGITPRHIQVIEIIHDEQEKGVRVSDIARILYCTSPSIIQLIKELTQKNLVVKEKIPTDKRVFMLHLTANGEKYYQKYVVDFHNKLAEVLHNISDQSMTETTETINRTFEFINKGQLI